MNKILTRALDFVKKHLIAIIVYSVAAIAMLITVLCLLNWALAGDIEKTVSVKSATLVALDADNPKTLSEEYIVGQRFDTRGWALKFGGRTVMLNADDIYQKYVTDVAEKNGIEQDTEAFEKLTAEGSKYAKAIAELEKVSINTDFNAAYNNKRAQIIYRQNNYVSYMAEVKGRALYVRAVEVETYPELVDMSGENPVIDDSFEIYAVLGNKPETDAFGEYEEVRGGWRIKLAENMYAVSTVADTSLDNFYTISFFCGDVSTEFSFYNAAGRSFVVSSKNNIVEYSTDAEDRGLTLIVTDRDASYQLNCTGTSEGSYVYRRGGDSTVYDFGYELTGTEELFESDEAVTESHVGGSYIANVDGIEFSALSDVWQGAVVNGIIVNDHGYKTVIESSKRILEFDYIKDFFVLSCESVSWTTAGGVAIDVSSAEISCKDNGAWNLNVGYKPSNGNDSALSIDGNEWKTVGGNIVLVVPDYEKQKTNGATELTVTRSVGSGKIELSADVELVLVEGDLHELTFAGESQVVTVAELEGVALFDAPDVSEPTSVETTLYGKLVVKSDLTWELSTGSNNANANAVADGYWHYKSGCVVLTVANDLGNVIYTPDIEDGEVKTVTMERNAVRGKYAYEVMFNYAYKASGAEAPVYVKLGLSGESTEGVIPSLTLYVSEYSMNPLLGTGNGYSRGVYIYTDAKGKSYSMTFYLQAWVWTYVPLSSTHGDVYAEASVNDYVKDSEGNWNTFRRGTMYADVTFFDRGNGFPTENFSAPEEKWLNALLNL